MRSSVVVMFVLQVGCSEPENIEPCTVTCTDHCPGDLVCGSDNLCHEPGAPICAGRPQEIADFSGVVPYDPNDFLDSVPTGNEASTIAAVTAPFADGFVVGAGRKLIEIPLDGTVRVHDFKPAVADTTGPDNIDHIAFGTDVVWLGSSTPFTGDGLFRVDAAWAIATENTLNNVAGVTWSTGFFDLVGEDTLYFTNGPDLRRRDGAMTSTMVYADLDALASIAIRQGAAFAVTIGDTTGLIRIESRTHAMTRIDTANHFEIAENGGLSSPVIVIRDRREIVSYDGTIGTVLASVREPDARWVAATVPRAPHPLAGRIIVVEVDRVRDRDRLLLIP